MKKQQYKNNWKIEIYIEKYAIPAKLAWVTISLTWCPWHDGVLFEYSYIMVMESTTYNWYKGLIRKFFLVAPLSITIL